MADGKSLVAVFEAITQNLERDREDLNQLDRDDGDSGDNMVNNFRLVTNTLQQQVGDGTSTDLGAALAQAAQVLRDGGKGATAPIYAQGLDQAASNLTGHANFSLSDLQPLLEGLLGGAQQSSGAPQGEGTLIDVLLPAIGAFSQAKKSGDGDLDAILGALLEARRSANRTSRSSTGHGRDAGRNTTGEIDPGAAGAASLLEGLFGALLKGALNQGGGAASTGGQFGGPSNLPNAQTQTQQSPTQPATTSNPVIDLLGSLFRK